MARKKSNAWKYGLMGAVVGGLDFQQRKWETARAEEAEIRKEQRLAAIRNQTAQFDSDLRKAEAEQGHGFRMTEQDDSQEFQAGESDKQYGAQRDLAQINNDASMARTQVGESGAMARARLNESGANSRNAAGITSAEKIAAMRADGQGDGVYGDDGKWYQRGTPLPPGVRPSVGFGATNLGVRGSNPLGVGAGAPAQKPRDYSGFSIQN